MLNLPKKLTEIGDEAFAGCESLYGSLILPKGMKAIGKAVFAGTHLGEREPAQQTQEVEEP